MTWSAPAALPNVTLPADWNVRPLRFVTAFISVVAVSPAAMVTFSVNVIAPAALAEAIPLNVSRVPSTSVVPVLLIVIAAPVPSPILVPLPTFWSNCVAPLVVRTRSKRPSTNELNVSAPAAPAPVVVILTLAA